MLTPHEFRHAIKNGTITNYETYLTFPNEKYRIIMAEEGVAIDELAYNQLKDHTEDPIGILYFECNYDEYTELHSNMTVKERNNAYAELEPPIRGVDCDVYVLADEL